MARGFINAAARSRQILALHPGWPGKSLGDRSPSQMEDVNTLPLMSLDHPNAPTRCPLSDTFE